MHIPISMASGLTGSGENHPCQICISAIRKGLSFACPGRCLKRTKNQNMPNKTALTNPLPLRSRSWRVKKKPNLNRRCAPSSGWQAFDVLLQKGHSKMPKIARRFFLMTMISIGASLLVPTSALAAERSEAAVKSGTGALQATGPRVPEPPAWPENPPDNWPIYHLAHPTFSHHASFDPNPALFYKGRYHLHYIYRIDAGFAYAHVSSKDMVHWKWHPTVLAPPNTGHGMYSGTGFFTKDEQPAIVYAGQGTGRNWIAFGLDNDLNKWSKPQVMLPKDKDGKPMNNMLYRDPDIWRDGKTFFWITCSGKHI